MKILTYDTVDIWKPITNISSNDRVLTSSYIKVYPNILCRWVNMPDKDKIQQGLNLSLSYRNFYTDVNNFQGTLDQFYIYVELKEKSYWLAISTPQLVEGNKINYWDGLTQILRTAPGDVASNYAS